MAIGETAPAFTLPILAQVANTSHSQESKMRSVSRVKICRIKIPCTDIQVFAHRCKVDVCAAQIFALGTGSNRKI